MLIIHIEDDDELRSRYGGVFRNVGLNVQGFTNPDRDLLDRIEERQPSVIVTDITMPVMDGFSFGRLLKSDPRTRDIPLVFLTSRSSSWDVKEGEAIGAARYFVKGAQSDEDVAEAVRTVARERTIMPHSSHTLPNNDD